MGVTKQQKATWSMRGRLRALGQRQARMLGYAVAESFFATIKRELIDARAWPTREGLRRTVFEYIEGWCNTRRLHSTLGYLSPAQCETIHHNADRQAA